MRLFGLGKQQQQSSSETYLGGKFVHVDFSDADMEENHLDGEFSSCDFTNTWLKNARLTGNFSGCIFTDADLTGALIRPVDWTNNTIDDALLTDDQWKIIDALEEVEDIASENRWTEERRMQEIARLWR